MFFADSKIENRLVSEKIDGGLNEELSGESKEIVEYGSFCLFLLSCTHFNLLFCNLGFRWTHKAVLLLLEEFRHHEKDMSSGKIT